MPSVIVKGAVNRGKFTPVNPAMFKQAFEQFEGKECEVVVQDVKKGRSSQQNRYMWGVVYKMIAEEVGDTTQNIHMQLCAMLAPPKVVSNGIMKDVVVQGHTSYMSTVELEDYLVSVRVWALDFLQLSIPLPNEAE